MTNTSAISMIPALSVWTSSPIPGTSTTIVTPASRRDFHFVLTHADCFHDDHVEARRVEEQGHLQSGSGETTEPSAGCHRTDEDVGVGVMVQHANAIAENRAAGVGTGGIDGHNRHGFVLFAQCAGELIAESALACAGWSCDSEN